MAGTKKYTIIVKGRAVCMNEAEIKALVKDLNALIGKDEKESFMKETVTKDKLPEDVSK